MPQDIAVYTNRKGEAASLYEPGNIVVYRKARGIWNVLRERSFCLDKSLGLRGLRQSMAEAIGFLAECRIFAALSVAGVPYFELEKAHYSVWEFSGKPADFLDFILEQEEQDKVQGAGRSNQIPIPVEMSEGCYTVSLTDIQAKNPGVTSKQVLQPFLRTTRFDSLEVLCSHVPPWLENELLAGNFCGEIEKVGKDEIKVLLTQKCS